MKTAISPKRSEDFSKWYQNIVKEGDLATNSPVRGCMIIRPNGYGLWENIQADLDQRFKNTGHENLYFPLFIPMSFIAKEAEHVEGFAKEMAVVTHHRLKKNGSELGIDPDAKLAEPLIVRPTSETIIGHHFKECINSYRDLPLLWNQWANVVRWEMRTRLFLRTAEFLWQEGHTAHATEEEARSETMKMLKVYRDFAVETLALPVIMGEKPSLERFPGAVATYSIEAMMQDGKALQAGTSHYLGTHFAEAQDIKYQSESGNWELCHTTSWGVSTRLIGAVIMAHSDDDGLRSPPKIAPKQIVIVPILRNKDSDQSVIDYCEKIAANLKKTTFDEKPLRVHIDLKAGKSVEKRWAWIKKGTPLICEIGARDVEKGAVSYLRRDRLRNDSKIEFHNDEFQNFSVNCSSILSEIHSTLFEQAENFLKQNIVDNIQTLDQLKNHFNQREEKSVRSPSWVLASWKKPSEDEERNIEKILKALKITIRNIPLNESLPHTKCIFSGEVADEPILLAQAY